MLVYKIEGYKSILAGVILTWCLLSPLYNYAQPKSTSQRESVSFYLKNDLDRPILLKIGKSTVSIDIGDTKKFDRPLHSQIFLVNKKVMGFYLQKGKKILEIDSELQGKKVLLSKIVKE
ncbi:MAG TPA: hypothetical protein DCS93_15035 [Microscillaceae bacterium]|nr:hypothetical protein [Microscillaceae bacterium]